MKDFILYTASPSRGNTVLWMLEECGADYEVVAMSFDDLKSPDYLTINPMGKVPALKHRNQVLTETAAIVTYLAEQFPNKNLIPSAGSEERGQYYRWLLFAIHLEYAGMDKLRGLVNEKHIRSSIGYGDLDTVVNTLRAHLENCEYIVDSHFTALDLYYTNLLDWLINRASALPADAVFIRYIERHKARPAASYAA
ncbi:glutathione S-transferase [Neisseria arctica]|uniref:Glutathione S-transferase n=1 Tax=Neisseria arctica TaxID=1470200 RepID=A0A0J0YT95_9NEIS|nr:glutathione S-transferase family protein [Neisseria arctica]KLT73322.1 glutathione S-transferase [Neisseria arctica]UOO87415.1 glutathione S-transferase family protein [Neisseria arctica]